MIINDFADKNPGTQNSSEIEIYISFEKVKMLQFNWNDSGM